MLQARIGRLEPGPRRAVRAASVFGQIFWRGGIAALLGMSAESPDLEGWLAELGDAEIIEPHASSRMKDEKEYGFRHMLLRDAAYSLLLPQDLVGGHRLAGEFLEFKPESDAGQVAEHFALAGVFDRAIRFLIRAATHHMDRYDLDAVLRSVERGIQFGATGPALGELLALKSQAALLRNDWLTGSLCGWQAFALLPHGSTRWCRLVGPLVAVFVFSNQWDLLVQTLQAFIAAEPEADGCLAYIDSAKATLTGALTSSGMRGPAQAILARMRQIGEHTPLYQAHRDCAVSAYEFYLGHDPWRAKESALRAVRAFSLLEDRNNLAIALCQLVQAAADLGAWEHCEWATQQLLTTVQYINEPLWLVSAQAYRVQCLTWRRPAESVEEIKGLVDFVNSCGAAGPFFDGVCDVLLSQALRCRGSHAEAEQAARRAQSAFAELKSLRLRANICLLEALTAQSKVQEAVAFAAELQQQRQDFGHSGSHEVSLLLAISEAFYAAGNVQTGQAALSEALGQLKLRHSLIPDSVSRNEYLTRNPFCARTLRLGQEMGIPIDME